MPHRSPHCKSAFVEVLGARMHYLHAGQGRPMLLIHGLVGSSTNWRRNIDALAQNASVYAVDMINMGKSGRVAGINASLEATADRIAATMDALGLDEADVVGHSHGGALALMLAARHPQRVSRLVLFAPANPFCALPVPMIRLYTSMPGKVLARCAPYLPQPVQLIALGRMYGDPSRIGDGCMKGYTEGLRKPGTVKHILAIVRDWWADMEALRTVLPRVAHVPTLLVWGDRDRAMSLASGRLLKRELAASELVIVPGGGHVVFEELPEEANGLMCEWLRCDPAVDASGVLAYAGSTPLSQGVPSCVSTVARRQSVSAMRPLSPEV